MIFLHTDGKSRLSPAKKACFLVVFILPVSGKHFKVYIRKAH